MCDRFATIHVVTFRLQVLVLVEGSYGESADELASKAKHWAENNRRQKNKRGNGQERGTLSEGPESPEQEMTVLDRKEEL